MLKLIEGSSVNGIELQIAVLKNHPKIAKLCLVLHVAAAACWALTAGAFWLTHAQFNAAAFRLETDYVRWTTPLPALTVCQEAAAMAPPVDARRNAAAWLGCQQLFVACSWNGRRFECCDRFKELVLQDGRCFSVNSLQTEQDGDQTPFVVKGTDKHSVFELQFSATVQMFVHDPGAVALTTPDVATPKQPATAVHRHLELSFTFRPLRVASSAWTLPLRHRACVLPGERTLPRHAHYSQSACAVECQLHAHIKQCACADHMLAVGQRCDARGRRCVARRFQDGGGGGGACAKACLPECVTLDVNVVRYSRYPRHGQGGDTARVTLLAPPRERLTMHALVGPVDALVAFACFSRLLTGVNLMSLTDQLLYVTRLLRR